MLLISAFRSSTSENGVEQRLSTVTDADAGTARPPGATDRGRERDPDPHDPVAPTPGHDRPSHDGRILCMYLY